MLLLLKIVSIPENWEITGWEGLQPFLRVPMMLKDAILQVYCSAPAVQGHTRIHTQKIPGF